MSKRNYSNNNYREYDDIDNRQNSCNDNNYSCECDCQKDSCEDKYYCDSIVANNSECELHKDTTFLCQISICLTELYHEQLQFSIILTNNNSC